jgi:hypothetical protein
MVGEVNMKGSKGWRRGKGKGKKHYDWRETNDALGETFMMQ